MSAANIILPMLLAIGMVGYLIMLYLNNKRDFMNDIAKKHIKEISNIYPKFNNLGEWHDAGKLAVEKINRSLDRILLVQIGFLILYCLSSALILDAAGYLRTPYIELYTILILIVGAINILTSGRLGATVSYTNVLSKLDRLSNVNQLYPLEIEVEPYGYPLTFKTISVVLLMLGQQLLCKPFYV